VIGLTFCTFLPRQFALPSPDSTLNEAQGINFLIEFGDAFDYSAADFEKWCREVGFKRVEVIHRAGPPSAAIAYK
jgi:hypothetical protein